MEIVYDDPIVIEDVTDIVSFVPETGQACIEIVPESETEYVVYPHVNEGAEKLTEKDVLVFDTDQMPF